MKRIFLTLTFIALFLTLAMPHVSSAVSVSVSAPHDRVFQGEEYEVEVRIDTAGELVNALSGTVLFPTSLFELKEINDGNSQINLWLERPKLANPGEIQFSGITPGGLIGNDLLLFTFVLRANASGEGIIKIGDIQMLRNDGEGTHIVSQVESLPVTVTTDPRDKRELNVVVDNTPPESFVPIIASDPNIFNGKKFLIFFTQDKGSGIDHYEVKEGFWAKYATAVSPHELHDQKGKKKIYVKAVDRSGNERVATVRAGVRSRLPTPLVLTILGIIFLVSFLWYKKWRKK